ncbi:hypothetical protein CJU89_2696 [Yarrowia sp. B02]|nr:hypothetical protein CJU89_2696 [Yarrowia sp. B02]
MTQAFKIEDIDELLVDLCTMESYPVNQPPPGPFDPIPLEQYEVMMGLDNSTSQHSVDSLRPRAPPPHEMDQSAMLHQQPQILTYQHHQHYPTHINEMNTNSYYMYAQPLPSPQTPQTPSFNHSPPEDEEMDSADSLDYMNSSAADSDYDPVYSSPSTVSSATNTPPETPTTPRAAKERKKGETVFLRPPAFAEETVGMFGMINFRKPGAWTRQKSK